MSSSINTKDLPKGWRFERLSDVSEVIGGGTPSTAQKEYWDGDIIWLSPTDLPAIGEIVEIGDSAKKISTIGLNNSSAKLLPVGTIVYSSRASIGKIGITTKLLATNQGFTNFICSNQLNNKYLAFALRHYTQDIASLSNSTTFAEVSKSSLKDFRIPVAPPKEQERIVAKLDALFEKLDAAIKLAEENLEHLSHLLPAALNEVFEKAPNKKLGDVITLQRGFDLPTQDRISGKYNIWGANGIIGTHNEFKVNSPCVVTGRSGSIGLMHYVEQDFWPLNTALYVKDFHNNLPKYTYYLLQSISKKIKDMAAFAAVPTLDRKNAHNIDVYSHNYSQQKTIVEYFDNLVKQINSTEKHYESKLKYLRALKASLLDATFKGQL